MHTPCDVPPISASERQRSFWFTFHSGHYSGEINQHRHMKYNFRDAFKFQKTVGGSNEHSSCSVFSSSNSSFSTCPSKMEHCLSLNTCMSTLLECDSVVPFPCSLTKDESKRPKYKELLVSSRLLFSFYAHKSVFQIKCTRA